MVKYPFCKISILFFWIKIALALQRKFPLCVPRKYSQDLFTYLAAAKSADRSWEYINFSQIHECRNWETKQSWRKTPPAWLDVTNSLVRETENFFDMKIELIRRVPTMKTEYFEISGFFRMCSALARRGFPTVMKVQYRFYIWYCQGPNKQCVSLLFTVSVCCMESGCCVLYRAASLCIWWGNQGQKPSIFSPLRSSLSPSRHAPNIASILIIFFAIAGFFPPL